MAPIEIDDFPSERNLHFDGWDFPWRTVSHNQMVYIHTVHELKTPFVTARMMMGSTVKAEPIFQNWR